MPTGRGGNRVNIGVHEAGAGSPVMLVHGLGMRADVWINQVDVFASRHRVLAPDLRGAGGSSHLTAPGSYQIDRFVDDLIAITHKFADRPIHFVGTSSGGFIGQVMALKAPELVRSLVLCHSASVSRIPARVLNARVSMLKNGTMEDYARLVAEQALATHQRPAVLDWFLEMVADNDRDIYRQIYIECMKSFDVRKRVKTITTPTLVVIGEHDRVMLPAGARETARLIPKARTALMRGVGHCGYIEQPLEFNRIVLQFIDRVEAAELKRARMPAALPLKS